MILNSKKQYANIDIRFGAILFEFFLIKETNDFECTIRIYLKARVELKKFRT